MTVLDVAAGTGFMIELAKAFPEAVVTAVDWPSVLEVASANAMGSGVASASAWLRECVRGGFGRRIRLSSYLRIPPPLQPGGVRDDPAEVEVEPVPNRSSLAVDFVPIKTVFRRRCRPCLPFRCWRRPPAVTRRRRASLTNCEGGASAATARPLRPTPQSLIMFERADQRDPRCPAAPFLVTAIGASSNRQCQIAPLRAVCNSSRHCADPVPYCREAKSF